MALSAALTLLPATAWAGAWTQNQGDTLLILKYIHSEGSSQFEDNHQRSDFANDGRSRLEQLNLYVEHGITDRTTLIGNFYFSQAGYRDSNDNQTTTGFADQEIGLRYALNSAGVWHHAVQGLVSFPGYSRGNPQDATPDLGLGDYGVEFRYSAGREFLVGSKHGYVDGGAAIRLRGAQASDEARFDITSGISFAERWSLIGELNVIQGLGNGDSSGTSVGPLWTGANYDLTKVQLSTLYGSRGGMQWQLGYQQPVLGRNTGAGGGPFVAAWWRF